MARLIARASRLLLPAVFLVSIAAVPADGQPALAAGGQKSVAAYPGLSRVFRDVSASTAAGAVEQEAAGLFDFELVVAAVIGRPAPGASMSDYRDAFAGSRQMTLAPARGSAARDDTAYRLHSLGYSPKEIADMLTGRITRSALDDAQKMLMLGARADRVSDFLDREYRRLKAARDKAAEKSLAGRPPARPAPGPTWGPSVLDAHAARYAAAYGVDPALVRAVIACESAWDANAVSRVGAVGPMQLMPSTARELGVDPRDPQQNIEGGVRYLAWLLKLFKTVEHALVAYNAGPGFATRYVKGQAALYGETRDFVRRVMGAM